MASFNGYAAEMTPAEAATVAGLPGVVRVEREQMFQPDTDAGPAWIGAPGIWDGSMTGGLPGTKGEGIIVGVIDTGIDPWNPSFAATGDDGYTVENPYGDGNYVGVCDPTNTDPRRHGRLRPNLPLQRQADRRLGLHRLGPEPARR